MRQRQALTLIEVVVVVAILGVLVSLLVPAIQKARAAAARVECSNKIKQLGLALQNYHSVHSTLPAGMYWQKGKDPMRMSTWLTRMLPYIEQQSLWETAVAAYKSSSNPLLNPPHTPIATLVGAFICPSDGRAAQIQYAPKDKIRVALTSYLGVSGRDYSTQDGCLYRDSRIRFVDITDGTSTTLLMGERPPSADFQFGWWYAGAGQQFTGSCDMILGVEEKNLLPIVVGSCAPGNYQFSPGRFDNQCDMFHFWSPHAGGGHFLFADGSVRLLSYDAAPIMPALASRAGGETIQKP